MDKAGSYGIQGVGGQFGESSAAVFILVPSHYPILNYWAVERLEGDYFTIMGLSMHRFSKELSQAIISLDI